MQIFMYIRRSISQIINDKSKEDNIRLTLLFFNSSFKPKQPPSKVLDQFTQKRVKEYRINGYNNSDLSHDLTDYLQYFEIDRL